MDYYQVEIIAEAQREVRRLPGNIRQRVIREIRRLQTELRPPESCSLRLEKFGVQLLPGQDLRRFRLDKWRIVYLIEEEYKLVWVLAIRKRPPYQYDDLSDLLSRTN